MNPSIAFQKIIKTLKLTRNVEIHSINKEFDNQEIHDALLRILERNQNDLIKNEIFRSNFYDLLNYFYIKESRNQIKAKKYQESPLFKKSIIDKLENLDKAYSNESLNPLP